MSDFTSVADSVITFAAVELDDGVDFTQTDDGARIVIEGYGYGEGGYGEGGYGGSETIIIPGSQTIWTNIDTP